MIFSTLVLTKIQNVSPVEQTQGLEFTILHLIKTHLKEVGSLNIRV